MSRKIIFFFFTLFITGAAFAQDTTATRKSTGAETTGERKRNPNTKTNPHPEGVVTGDRIRNPVPSQERKAKDKQPASEEKRSSPQD